MEAGTSAGGVVALGLGLFILYVALSGLIVGALARWALPGPDPMSWPATIGFGIAGSFLGGAGQPAAAHAQPGGIAAVGGGRGLPDLVLPPPQGLGGVAADKA